MHRKLQYHCSLTNPLMARLHTSIQLLFVSINLFFFLPEAPKPYKAIPIIPLLLRWSFFLLHSITNISLSLAVPWFVIFDCEVSYEAISGQGVVVTPLNFLTEWNSESHLRIMSVSNNITPVAQELLKKNAIILFCLRNSLICHLSMPQSLKWSHGFCAAISPR